MIGADRRQRVLIARSVSAVRAAAERAIVRAGEVQRLFTASSTVLPVDGSTAEKERAIGT
jgi:hypothetical protein